MKKIKIHLFLFATAALLLSTACSNFEDINKDPDQTNKVPSSMLCTNTLLRITKFGGDAKAYIATNALPKYVAYANESQMAEQYNKIGAGSFGNYGAWPNLDDMVKYARGEKFENSYLGISYFVKV